MFSLVQDTPSQLRRLAAQRELYSFAKGLFAWHTLVSGPVIVALAFTALAFPGLKSTAAILGLLVALADLVWLTPWQKRLKDRAARVQELFDCEALELEWNTIAAGKKPSDALIGEYAASYERHASWLPTLRDWYPPVVRRLPVHLGRLVCQHANCTWDVKQRKHYAYASVALAAAVFISVLLLCTVRHLNLETFFLSVVAPLSPTLVFGIRQFVEHSETAIRVGELQENVETTWHEALTRLSPADTTARSRSIQDQLFAARKRGPLILDRFFRLMRPRNEERMRASADQLVSDALRVWGQEGDR